MKSIVYLPLHRGHAPRWLFNRMVELGKAISKVIIADIGSKEYIRRLSNPYWFQAFGCALGFDWHSSGLTTVLTGVLKEIFKEGDEGIYVIGGKGKEMLSIPRKLEEYIHIGGTFIERLKIISKLSAKTDSILLQDGYDLYHQAIIFDEKRNWSLIEQGMNIDVKYARRYHWNDFNFSDKYIIEPHSGILADKIESKILNLIDNKSTESKKIMLDIIRSKSFKRDLEKAYKMLGIGLYKWLDHKETVEKPIEKLIFPKKINWDKVKKLYEEKPSTIPEFLEKPYTNRDIVRGLALISHLIYGSEIAWKDTLKYTFTVGGKDGVPFPVNRKTYDSLINYLKEAIEGSEISRKEKRNALRRLAKIEII